MEKIKLSPKAINRAVDAIKVGRVIIFPTDTIYGFLAEATNKKAVERIFKIKKRPKTKPLAVFIKDIKTAKELAEINDSQLKIIKKYWPGKYTFILKRKNALKLFGLGKETIGLRVPEYKPLNDLLEKVDMPLAQTSVNISGKSPLISLKDMVSCFNKYDILIVDGGGLKNRKSSKVFDLTDNKIKILRK